MSLGEANSSAPPVLSEAERHTVLIEWNQTAVDYPRDVLLHQLVESQARRTPESIAVVDGTRCVTYSQLDQRANRLANRLRKLGVGPDVLVAVCAERSLEMVVALLASMKAGGAYVPLDPEYPQDRLLTMLRDSHSPVVLTQVHLLGAVPKTQAEIICVDRDWSSVEQESAACPLVQMTAKNLAYCIYTSGSTGKPKGVPNVHEAIVNRVLWMRDQYNITTEDRILQKTPYSFDVSVWEFFLPLLTGATLVMARPGGHKDPAYLVEVIRDERITALHFVPSMLALFLESEGMEQCSSVRHVFASGEALSFELQSRFFKRFHGKLHNLYGPTEAAVDVTYWECSPNYERPMVPIGKPVANTQIYILDEHLQPVGIGAPGELYIGGIQLARGYLNRPELTKEKFIPDPFGQAPDSRLYKTGDLARFLPDGNIEYLGRIDNQVKLRGFRIELGEIEAVLSECPGVQLTAVTVREDVPGDKRLIAYLVRIPNRDLSLESVRSYLKTKLPEFMVPSRFVVLDEMPLTTSGKVDRNALPHPPVQQDSAYIVGARTDLESAILPIFSKILGVKSLGVKDDFFELGGHSLLAAKLLNEVKQVAGKQIPLSAMVRASTVESLAALLSSGAPPTDSFVTQVQSGEKGNLPLFAVVIPGVETLGYAALGRYLGPQPFYTLQARRPQIKLPFLRKELESLASEYVAALRSVQASGPYCFIAMCDDVVITQEMILQLERAGHQVGFFAILDTWVLENSMVPWKWRTNYYSLRLRQLGKVLAPDRLKALLQMIERKVTADNPKEDLGDVSAQRPGWKKAYWPGAEFQQPRFQAPIVMFKRPQQPFFYIKDSRMGWGQRSLGGVEIHDIDLDHENLLREPHIRAIGKVLIDRLQQTVRLAGTWSDPVKT